jgi:hypothetical protein
MYTQETGFETQHYQLPAVSIRESSLVLWASLPSSLGVTDLQGPPALSFHDSAISSYKGS